MFGRTMQVIDSLVSQRRNANKNVSYCFNNYECLTYRISECDRSIRTLHIRNDLGTVQVLPAREGAESLEINAAISIKGDNSAIMRDYIQSAVQISMGDTIIVDVSHGYQNSRKLSKPQINFILYVPEHIEVVLTGAYGTVNVGHSRNRER